MLNLPQNPKWDIARVSHRLKKRWYAELKNETFALTNGIKFLLPLTFSGFVSVGDLNHKC
jgi:hypothetical protein